MTEEPLDVMRVMTLVTDAVTDFHIGIPAVQSARAMLIKRQPTSREVEAARQENLALHGGPRPWDERLAQMGVPPLTPPPAVLRTRRAVDERLSVAAALLRPPPEVDRSGRGTSG